MQNGNCILELFKKEQMFKFKTFKYHDIKNEMLFLLLLYNVLYREQTN